MANVKSNFQKVLDDCWKIYENFGYERVIRHVEIEQANNNPLYKDVVDKRCDACDNIMPSLYNVCLICDQSVADKIPQKGTRPNYFEVKSQGWNAELMREEIQINCGENGMLMIVKTDEGFVVDAYDVDGENMDTMAVWEDDINPLVDDDEFTATGQFIEEDIKAYLKEWGQSQGEITSNLGYPRSHAESDDLLMEDYFFLEGKKQWYPKISRMYSEEEQLIADYVRNNRDNY